MSVETIGGVTSALGTLATGYGTGIEDMDNAQMTRGVSETVEATVAGPAGLAAAQARSVNGTTGVGDSSGTDFATLLAGGLDKLQATQSTADDLALQAATGDLQNVHDYMIASTEAQLATQLTVAVRDKAVNAFNEIMRMQI